jgi:hypothetical protein
MSLPAPTRNPRDGKIVRPLGDLARGWLHQRWLSLFCLPMRSPGQRAFEFALPGLSFSGDFCEGQPDLPETPLASFHDPEAEKQVGDGVGQHARRQAFRPIRDAIIERARNEGRDPVRPRMGKPEPHRYSRKGRPRERANRDGVEFFANEIAKRQRPGAENGRRSRSSRWLAGPKELRD